jgi:hypothetical protein
MNQRLLISLLALGIYTDTFAVTTFPSDVQQFISRRENCDHFRGEEPYDEERRQFLEKSMNELCRGSDKQLARLKEKYRANRLLMDKLNEYEKNIEAK